MKFIIFVCLLIYLHCYEKNYSLEKYGHIFHIREGEKGIISLDLSNFARGDTVYLTFIVFDDYFNYNNTLKYCFSNSKTKYNTLDKTAFYYSYSYGSVTITVYYRRKISFDSNVPYKEYYYKIKIPTNEDKANYLLMGYDLSKYWAIKMNVINTKFARYTLLIIAFSCFGFILLIIFILCLCKHRLKVCWDRANPNQNNIGINNENATENALYPSSDNQEKLNDETEKEKIEIKDITDNNPQDNDVAPPQADYYPTSE